LLTSRPRAVLAAILATCLIVPAIAPPSRAQEAPRGGNAAAVAEEEEGGPGQPQGQASRSFLSWMVRASGPIGLVILLMSFYLIALVVWMSFEYRRSVALPEALIAELNELLGHKRFPEAFQRVSADTSLLGRTLAAGVRKLPSGLPNALRAMEMANDDVTMEMEHRTTYLATVGTLGPMIGLVGTVYGMIRSFQVMATAGGSPQASQLAGGISTALFATLEGIAISIPAISFYALFRNRIARLSLEAAMTSESFLEQFAPGVRPPHPLATGGTSTGPRRPALTPPKDEG